MLLKASADAEQVAFYEKQGREVVLLNRAERRRLERIVQRQRKENKP